MLLELDGVDASIEGINVLRGIDLAVDESETVGIIGRNGAGKTSTFRSVMGLQTVQQGSVSFRGEDITNMPTHERKRLGIGFAPEDPDDVAQCLGPTRLGRANFYLRRRALVKTLGRPSAPPSRAPSKSAAGIGSLPGSGWRWTPASPTCCSTPTTT